MSGHPIPISGPRVGAARAQARGAEPVSQSAGVGSLTQLVADLRLSAARLLAMTSRQWDPASGPQQQDAPLGPDFVDIQLGKAAADFRSALRELDELREVLASQHPTRPAPGHATTGAPVPASSESGGPATAAGASSDPRPRRAQRNPSHGNGVRPGVGFAAGAAPMGFTLPAPARFAVGESMARHW